MHIHMTLFTCEEQNLEHQLRKQKIANCTKSVTGGGQSGQMGQTNTKNTLKTPLFVSSVKPKVCIAYAMGKSRKSGYKSYLSGGLNALQKI